MYAIRSYYDIINTIKNNEDVKESVSYKMLNLETTTDLSTMYTDKYSDFLTDKGIRITSYNVCYTKLLRHKLALIYLYQQVY